MYDPTNIFAKVLRGDIPCKRVHETPHALAFEDIAPKAPVHVLVIPKGEYVSFNDFVANANAETISGFFRAVQETATMLEVADTGYRLIANCGNHGGQEVPHFHVHILGGKKLGAMVGE